MRSSEPSEAIFEHQILNPLAMRNSAFSTGTYKEGLFHCHVTQPGDQPQSAERHSDRHLRSLREFLFGQGIVELLGRDEQLMNS